MNKLTFGISTFLVCESLAIAALGACPLPRDQVCVTSPKDCSEELPIEREITANASTTTVDSVQMHSPDPAP